MNNRHNSENRTASPESPSETESNSNPLPNSVRQSSSDGNSSLHTSLTPIHAISNWPAATNAMFPTSLNELFNLIPNQETNIELAIPEIISISWEESPTTTPRENALVSSDGIQRLQAIDIIYPSLETPTPQTRSSQNNYTKRKRDDNENDHGRNI